MVVVVVRYNFSIYGHFITSNKTQKPFLCLNLTRTQQVITSLVFCYRLRVKIWHKEALEKLGSNIFGAIS